MSKVLVIAEHQHGVLSPATLATIACARLLSQAVEVLLAIKEDNLSQEIAQYEGVVAVQVVKHDCFEHLLAENVAPVIVELAKDYSHILGPSTTFGKNLMPRIAALLDVAQISDVTEIVDAQTFVHPIYAGNAFETVQALDNLKILTVRTTAFTPVTKSNHRADIHLLNFNVKPFAGTQFVEAMTPELTRPELTAAKTIVSGGRALKSVENFKMIEQLADLLGGAVGASRAAVDAGFVPNDFQVGQTGKIVAPTLYIAIGISGAIQHLAGMKDSKVIVAINKDGDAPIFQVADYGLVGDLFTIVPEFIKAIQK